MDGSLPVSSCGEYRDRIFQFSQPRPTRPPQAPMVLYNFVTGDWHRDPPILRIRPLFYLHGTHQCLCFHRKRTQRLSMAIYMSNASPKIRWLMTLLADVVLV